MDRNTVMLCPSLPEIGFYYPLLCKEDWLYDTLITLRVNSYTPSQPEAARTAKIWPMATQWCSWKRDTCPNQFESYRSEPVTFCSTLYTRILHPSVGQSIFPSRLVPHSFLCRLTGIIALPKVLFNNVLYWIWIIFFVLVNCFSVFLCLVSELLYVLI